MVALGAPVGCAGRKPEVEPAPLLVLRDERRPLAERLSAAGRIADAGGGLSDPARRTMVEIAGDPSQAESLRVRAWSLLLAAPGAADDAAARQLAREWLAVERSRAVVDLIADAAGSRGWGELVTPLVRAAARPAPDVTYADRREVRALQALRPDEELLDVVWAVLVSPELPPASPALRLPERTRADAWDVLMRLDPGAGTIRRLVRTAAVPADAPGAGLIAGLRSLEAATGVLPARGGELDRVMRLTSDGTSAARLPVLPPLDAERRVGLELVHLAPLAWAAAHRPALIDLTRDAAIAEIGRRLADRQRESRVTELPGELRRQADTLAAWAPAMSWADAVVVLAVDECLADAGVRSAIARYARLDFEDRQTEYGGLIAPDPLAPQRPVARLYRPIAGARGDDDRYIASDDLLIALDGAIAFFHLQVRTRFASRDAGPSAEDMEFVSRHGLVGVVFTSVSSRKLNADVYLPSGVVLDLGMVPADAGRAD